jgi:hypothetical protein
LSSDAKNVKIRRSKISGSGLSSCTSSPKKVSRW